MEANQGPRSGVELKLGPDQTDEMLGSEVNQKFAEMCLNTGVEAVNIPEKQYDQEARLAVHQKFAEMCLDTAVETDINQEKHADPEARSEVNGRPKPCQDTVMEADVNPEEQAAHPGVIYRCKKCRRMVARQEYVVTHNVGQGERCFLRRKSYHVDEKEPECACIFVESMKWMQAG
jgi:dual specificity phosphatase 12